MSLFDKTTHALGASLNFRLQRQNLIGANIANAETPGYHAQKLDFEGALSRALELDGANAMAATHSQHQPMTRGNIEKVRADIYDNPEIPTNNDKNTVDLEREMADLAENTILYRTATELMRKKLGAMKYAASDGGR
jgi:flagellar basal-body rod protein FlgB